jgi:hypothetical protein
MRFTGLLVAIPLLLTLAACDQKPATPTEQIKDKVGDALDSRPQENIRDAAEDLGEGVKDAADDLKK